MSTLGFDFKQIRESALEALRAGIYRDEDDYQYPALCDLDHSGPSGIGCNTHDHLQALEDLLQHGTWVDAVMPNVCIEDSSLYRYFVLVAWATEGCLDDLHQVLKCVGDKQGLSKSADNLKGYINRVFKHRSSKIADTGVAAHACLHHGPHYFADDRSVELDSCDLTLENWRGMREVPCSVLIPSLGTFVDALTNELDRALAISEACESMGANL